VGCYPEDVLALLGEGRVQPGVLILELGQVGGRGRTAPRERGLELSITDSTSSASAIRVYAPISA